MTVTPFRDDPTMLRLDGVLEDQAGGVVEDHAGVLAGACPGVWLRFWSVRWPATGWIISRPRVSMAASRGATGSNPAAANPAVIPLQPANRSIMVGADMG